MTIRERLTELASDQSELGGPELLPVRLARACTTVLPVAGAGLSLYSTNDFRVPIGASDDMAADAERLQFTLGEGPCLAAHFERRVIAASGADMQRLWPQFYAELVAGSSYRSIVSVPLQQGLQGVAALDLYLDNSTAEVELDRAELATVADTVTGSLLGEPRQADAGHGGGPAWLDSPTSRRRSTVWSAIGMINVSLSLSTVDALAVLRGYSYSHETTVDQLAERLVSGRLPVDALFQES
jgi:hypothetical protein